MVDREIFGIVPKKIEGLLTVDTGHIFFFLTDFDRNIWTFIFTLNRD